MHTRLMVVISVTLIAPLSRAEVVEYTDAQAWHDATGGQYSTIDFTGFADGTSINNQYQDLGITFTPPTFIFESAGFVNDGWGLHGPAGVRFDFDSPQNWVAIHHPGTAQFRLYNQGELIYTSSYFFHGGLGNFAGLASTIPFDEVYIFRPPPNANQVFIDDLHWGAPVPVPSALALLGITGLLTRSRRRKR